MATFAVMVSPPPLLFPPGREHHWRHEGNSPKRISRLKHLHPSLSSHLCLTQSCSPGQNREESRDSASKYLLRMDHHPLTFKLFSDYGLWNLFIYRHRPTGQTGISKLPFGLGPSGSMGPISSITRQLSFRQAVCLWSVICLQGSVSLDS